MSLYQRVRPGSFDDVVGNVEVVSNLRSLTSKDDPPHAYLLTGPSGCGKTTLGRIIAMALGVSAEDVETQLGNYREVDSVQFRGIDTIREIREGAPYMGFHGGRRVWLLDEVHRLPGLSQDALLKGLEDPPDHAFFVLCTTNPDALLDTIKGRCSQHKVSPLSEGESVRLLHRVASGEGHKLPRPLLAAIYEKTQGKSRDALQLLEKVLAADEGQRDAVVAAAESVKSKTESLARELMRPTGWKSVASILETVEEDDVESVRRGVIGYVSKVLLGGENDRAMVILDQMVEPMFNVGKAGLIHACYLICKA